MKQRAVWLPNGDTSTSEWLVRERLSGHSRYDEKWLQQLLYERPEIIPISTIDIGSSGIVSVCRELSLPKDNVTVYLDMLGVARTGRLTLVECKLWRNPQARREVVGQILEYAGLLKQWSYGDLIARLKARLGWKGSNPLYDHVKATYEDLDESAFVEGVSKSLAHGDFNLVIAGDGIRTDVQAIKGYLDSQSGLVSRIALVEFQIWRDAESGGTLVIPAIPFRTTVVPQRVLVSHDGKPLMVESSEDDQAVDEIASPGESAKRLSNRVFWQTYIDTIELDHPDQARPRHGGNNWVKLQLPSPALHLTVWRSAKGTVGMFFRLTGVGADDAYEALSEVADTLRQETGLPLRFEHPEGKPPYIAASEDISSNNPDGQLTWLYQATNGFVNAFRPRLSALDPDS